MTDGITQHSHVTAPAALSRGEARRAVILEAARDVFLECGFEGASLDDILRRSGGSRSTLYEQFGNKEGLFGALITKICEEIVAPLAYPAGENLEEKLYFVGRRYLDAILNPTGLGLYRLVAGESARFPALGQQVYAAGPGRAAQELAAYLRRQTARNDLSIANPDLAARQFLELVKGDLHTRALFNVTPAPSEMETSTCVREAVRIFLYGIRSIWRAA